jgi:hypothetical protein
MIHSYITSAEAESLANAWCGAARVNLLLPQSRPDDHQETGARGTASHWRGGSVMFGRERARRRERDRADNEMISELKWQWRSAVQGTPLAPIVYTPSGPTRAVPIVGHVDLGPPVTFTVRIRPGQTIADFLASAPSIAPAFGVAELEVTPLVSQWVKIVFVPHHARVAVPDTLAELDLEALRSGA